MGATFGTRSVGSDDLLDLDLVDDAFEDDLGASGVTSAMIVFVLFLTARRAAAMGLYL